MQYLSHAPKQEGDEIQIELRPVRITQGSEISPNSQESLRWQPTQSLPLREVSYEAVDDTRGHLIITLTRSLAFRIKPLSDARGIRVELIGIPAETPQPAPAASTQAAAPLPLAARPYVINLTSSLDPITLPELRLTDRAGLTLYIMQARIEGRTWNRLRLGFFPDQATAERTRQRLLNQFPQAWLARASREEINQARSGAAPSPATSPLQNTIATEPPLREGQAEQLMEQARQAMAQGNYSHAIQLYTKLLLHKGHPFHQAALEYLGLARERNHQLAHAKAEYERYLSLYPEGEGSDRVRQRLAALTTARSQPKTALQSPGRANDGEPWEYYGGFSQYYRRDVSATDISGTSVDQSVLSNDIDITARRRGSRYDIESRFSGGYEHDFLKHSTGSRTTVSSMYVDLSSRSGMQARLGRQTRSTGGVLGRFDGALLSQPVRDWLRLNAVAGYPVYSTRNSLDTHRQLYGLSADIGPFAQAWEFVLFGIEQRADGYVDRRAIGGEVRYFKPTRSLLGTLDYDIHYHELNTLLLLGNLTLPNNLTLNATLDYRNSPILTTSNALIGQTVTTLDALSNQYTEAELIALASDRTVKSRTVTVGATKPLNSRFQVNADMTVSDMTSSPASGGVDALPASGPDYFYSAQLIGTGIFHPNDIGILGLRYSNTTTSDTVSLSLNSRYPITDAWRINPRLRMDHRNNKNNDTRQWTLAGSVRTEYIWRRRTHFELELGGEWSNRQLTVTTENDRAYFLEMGYRVDF